MQRGKLSRSLGTYYSWASRGEEGPWGADKAVPSGTDTILLQHIVERKVTILGTPHSNLRGRHYSLPFTDEETEAKRVSHS